MGKENFQEDSSVALTYEDVPCGQISLGFFTNTLMPKVDWGNWVRVCIDGAASMTGHPWCSSKN